jgi:hypothetical protein
VPHAATRNKIGLTSGLKSQEFFTSQLLADFPFLFDMRILLAGIMGGIVMFVWTSIAHMPLPRGEAGIAAISNESAMLNAMQSSIGDKTGLYIFPRLGVAKNATRPSIGTEEFTSVPEVLDVQT